MNSYSCSLKVNLSRLTGKKFKTVSDTIRSIVKQEHGYSGTAGLTDNRLGKWPISIRFITKQNRKIAYLNLHEILSPSIINVMDIEKLNLKRKVSCPVRVFKTKSA